MKTVTFKVKIRTMSAPHWEKRLAANDIQSVVDYVGPDWAETIGFKNGRLIHYTGTAQAEKIKPVTINQALKIMHRLESEWLGEWDEADIDKADGNSGKLRWLKLLEKVTK